jgi:hypothetical protein
MNLSNTTVAALAARKAELEKQVETFGAIPADIRLLDDLARKIAEAEKPVPVELD